MKIKQKVKYVAASSGRYPIAGHSGIGFNARGRVSGQKKEPVLLMNFKKLCYLQFRQGSTGPLADPDPSPPAFFVFPSVICAPSFQTFKEESLNLHSPAPFLP
ncbi:MAG: hypothetical protein WBN03_02785 [Desulfobacterales bacterium]